MLIVPPHVFAAKNSSGNGEPLRSAADAALGELSKALSLRPEEISMDLCAMTWCISHTCITCSFSTGTRVPCTDEGDRTEGVREARPGSTGGVIISRAD